MLVCKKCNVKVAGSPEYCPLCCGDLFGEAELENNILPVVYSGNSKSSIIKVITAFFIVIAIASIGLNVIFTESGRWSILVILGLSALWLSIYFILKYKRNIIKNIFIQAFILIVLVCCLDNITGYTKWANSYAVPIILIIAIISTIAVARFQRLNIGDYLFYFMINCIVGVYSFRYIMYATKQITVVYPTAICFVVSMSAIVLTLIFESKQLASEIRRRLHF